MTFTIFFSHNRYSKIMTNLWNEISDTADLNRDGAVTLQELQVKQQTDRQTYRQSIGQTDGQTEN